MSDYKYQDQDGSGLLPIPEQPGKAKSILSTYNQNTMRTNARSPMNNTSKISRRSTKSGSTALSHVQK